jgi:hypothetical protein
MDIFTLLLFMLVIVLAVMVLRLRRGGGTCKCPVDQKWVDEFNRWAAAEYLWAEQVQTWIDGYDKCLAEKCQLAMGNVEPPKPPPCKFGSC